METPDFMVQLRAQLESAASESGSGKSGSNSTSAGANSSDIRCFSEQAIFHCCKACIASASKASQSPLSLHASWKSRHSLGSL